MKRYTAITLNGEHKVVPESRRLTLCRWLRFKLQDLENKLLEKAVSKL